jgi:glycosyltransferase involved in cell wall biosynthesis
VRVVRYPAADLGPPDVLGEGFLFTSRLVPEKGCRLLLEAWQRSGTGRHSTLTIAGAGPESVLARAASGRDGVKYVGLVEPGTASELRKRSAVVVVPSLWNEPGSVAVTLALAAGRAVIATNVGGLPEAVDDAVGWCVPPTVSGLTAALEAASDRAQQRVKASRARSRYEALYSQRQTVRLLLATYEDLLRDSTGRRR